MNLNQVFIAGNLTRDPETFNAAGSGTTVAKFGIAINEYSEHAEDKKRTTFVDCVCFGKRGEALAKYLEKGSPIFIRGRLSFSTWKDKDSGATRTKLNVVVDDWQFVGPKQDKGDDKPERKTTRKENVPF